MYLSFGFSKCLFAGGKVTYNVTPLDVRQYQKIKLDFISKMIGYANDQKFRLIFLQQSNYFLKLLEV
jgi:hypothetical protein